MSFRAQQDGYKAEDVVESFDNVTILFAYITGFKVRQVLLWTVLLSEALGDAHTLSFTSQQHPTSTH
eukprot:19029-Heterococcus_DN1.PRE.1